MEPIDEMIRGAMPRAPRGIADAVERRLAARRRSRRALAGAGVLVAAAAALVLWLVARPAPTPPSSAWFASSATATTIDGEPIAIGKTLAVGAVVHVADGGAARLERPSAGERAVIALAANTDARVGDGALELLTGQARLEGPEARVTGDVAEVTTLGVGAAATVEMRRNPMSIKKAATLAALLTVGVVAGGARVEAKGHAPLLLAKNDRTMIAPRLPPVTTRAATKTPPPGTAKTPVPAATKPQNDVDGQLDKDTIRGVVRGTLSDITACYDAALKHNEDLAGRIVVRFTIVTKDGKGRVSDGEIQPEDGDLNEPRLEQCILQVLGQAQFPPSADGEPVIVSYPFVLSR